MNTSRFAIMHVMLVGLIIAGWLLGYLPVILAADKFHAFIVVGSLLLIGLGLAVSGRTTAAMELADDLPVVGLGMTIIGLLWGANTATDVDAFRKVMIDCTTGTLSGFMSYYWLKNVVRLCFHD